MQTDAAPLLEQLCVKLDAHCEAREIKDPLVVGIHTGGAWVAKHIHERLAETGLAKDPLGTLDISFYRDDFTRIGLNPKVKPSNLPVITEGRHVILVDDGPLPAVAPDHPLVLRRVPAPVELQSVVESLRRTRVDPRRLSSTLTGACCFGRS